MKRIVKRALVTAVAVLVLGTIVSENVLPSVKAATTNCAITVSCTSTASGNPNFGLDITPLNATGESVAGQGPINFTNAGGSGTLSIDESATQLKLVLQTAGHNLSSMSVNGSALSNQQIADIVTSSGCVIPFDNNMKDGFTIAVTITPVGGGGQGGNQGGNNPPPPQNSKDISVVLHAPDGLCHGIRIDGRNMDPDTKKVQVESGKTDRKIDIGVEFGKGISKITINGSEINPIPPEDQGWITIDGIADADSYTIELQEGESDNITMVWAYDANNPYGDDAFVENGQVELLSINRGGEEIPFKDLVSEDGGYIPLQKGDDVTVKLIPDYGYQLKSASVNEQELEAQADVSTFLLRDLQGNIHFSSIFVKTSDVATSNSKIATSPTILDGGNAVASGNLSLSIDDNENYTRDITSAVTGNGVTKVASLDLELDHIVSKGNGEHWVTNITEFEKPVNVSVNVPPTGLNAGETYSVVRDHNGVLTELESTYSDGRLVFATNRFSTYTIVKKTATAPSIASSTVISPKTGESFPTNMLLLFAVTGLGAFALLFRKCVK